MPVERNCKECGEKYDFKGGSLFCTDVCRRISLKICGFKSKERSKRANGGKV